MEINSEFKSRNPGISSSSSPTFSFIPTTNTNSSSNKATNQQKTVESHMKYVLTDSKYYQSQIITMNAGKVDVVVANIERRDSSHNHEKKSHKSRSNKHVKDRNDRFKSKIEDKKRHKKDKKHKHRKHSHKHEKKSKKDSRKTNDDTSSTSSSSSSESEERKNSQPVRLLATSDKVNTALCGLVSDPITKDDYFTKNQEFRVWLRHCQHPQFESLSSKEAHHIFTDLFIPAYNSGSLPPYYYTGDIPAEVKHVALHTQHRWNFRLNPSERDQLQSVTDSIDVLTNRPTSNTNK